MTKGLNGIGFIGLALAFACSEGSGHPPGADAGVGGGTAGGVPGTGGSGGSDANSIPAACGTFETAASKWFTTATLHGPFWAYCNPQSSIDLYSADPGAPICAKGKVANQSNGDPGYAYVQFNLNEVFGTVANLNDDAGTDAGASSSYTAWESYIPQSDGMIVNLDNKAKSNLWLCLQGTNFNQWCLTEITNGAFYRWSDFSDNWGRGVSYAGQPILSLEFQAPGNAGSFDFCVTGFVEAASWCACPGGTCACPAGMNACNGTCVATLSVNPLNCGTCGKVCSSSAACRDDDCRESIVAEVPGPNSLAIDGNTLYFTDDVAGTVMKVGLSGGTPEVVASGQDTPSRIVVAGGILYWVNAGTEANSYSDSAIMSLVGNVPTPLASGQNNVAALAVDSKFAYFASAGTKSVSYVDGAILKLDLGAGASGTPVPLATRRPHPRRIAIDANTIYWVEQGSADWGHYSTDGQVLMLALDAPAGTAPKTLKSGLTAPMAIAVDANYAYVGCAETVVKIALADGTTTTLATGQSQPFAMAADSTNVYWTNNLGGSLVTVPIEGAAQAVTLAKGQNYAAGLALSATDVYFATQSETLWGGIQKVAK